MDMLYPLFVYCFFAMANGQPWVTIPGRVTHISARNGQIWATTETTSVLHNPNGIGSPMGFTTGGGQYVAAATDGRAWLLRTDLSSDNVYRYNIITNSFEHMPGTLRQISAADGDNAVGVNYLGDIWRWQNDTWTQIPGKAVQVSMSVEREIYSIDANSNVYHLNGSAWQSMGFTALYIDMHDRNYGVTIDFNQDAHMWYGLDNTLGQAWTGQKCVKVTFSPYEYLICQDIAGGLHYLNLD